jgi:hypothetical protein
VVCKAQKVEFGQVAAAVAASTMLAGVRGPECEIGDGKVVGPSMAMPIVARQLDLTLLLGSMLRQCMNCTPGNVD